MLGSQIIRFGCGPWADFLRIANFPVTTETLLETRIQERLPENRRVADLRVDEIAEHATLLQGRSLPELKPALEIYDLYLSTQGMSVAQAVAARRRASQAERGMTLREALEFQAQGSTERGSQAESRNRLSRLLEALKPLGDYADDEDVVQALAAKASRIARFSLAEMGEQCRFFLEGYPYPENLAYGAAFCFLAVDRSGFLGKTPIPLENVESLARAITQKFTTPTDIDHSLNLSSLSAKDAVAVEEALRVRQRVLDLAEPALLEFGDPYGSYFDPDRGLRMREEDARKYGDRLRQVELAVQSQALSLGETTDVALRKRHARRIETLLTAGSVRAGSKVFDFPRGIGAQFSPMFPLLGDLKPTRWAFVWQGHHDVAGVLNALEGEGRGAVLYMGPKQLAAEEAARAVPFFAEIIAERFGAPISSVEIESIESRSEGTIPLRAARHEGAELMSVVEDLLSGKADESQGHDPEALRSLRRFLSPKGADGGGPKAKVIPFKRPGSEKKKENDDGRSE